MKPATSAIQSPQTTAAGRVAILMGTYNGAAHLQEQLDSLVAQTHRDWVLVVSDDGSSDATLAILHAFQAQLGEHRVMIRSGPRNGFVANFLSLACDPGCEADYYAFCDQDDIWHADKLERALARLASCAGQPGLVCGRTRFVSEAGAFIGYSALFSRTPCFRNALVQSIAGGNTMVFNRHAQQLVAAAGPRVKVASHDWWMYLLVSGANGRVIYDPQPALDYRQHGNNLVGANVSLRAKCERLIQLWAGRFRHWNSLHEAALIASQHLLSPANQNLFEAFRRARHAGPLTRIRQLRQARLYRQSPLGTLAVYASCLIKKF